MELYDWFEGRIYTEKRKNLFLVQKKSKKVYLGADKKEVYLIVKVTIDCTSIFY